MDNTSRMDVFQATLQIRLALEVARCIADAYKDLVQEVLYELLLENSRGEETLQVSAQKVCNKVATVPVNEVGCKYRDLTYFRGGK